LIEAFVPDPQPDAHHLGRCQLALSFAGGNAAAVPQAVLTGFRMAFEPLIDCLPADAGRFGGLSLGLANGQDQEHRPGTKSFLSVAANAAEIFPPHARRYIRFPSECQV
jgi:hypothetical protein